MKKMHRYFYLFVWLISFTQINNTKEAPTRKDNPNLSVDKAFVKAVENNDSKEVQKLIKEGADINQQISYTQTLGDCDWTISNSALEYAAAHGHADIVKILIKSKAKTTNINKILFLAAKNGHTDATKEFVQISGINIDHKFNDCSNKTALHVAVENGHLNTVKELIKAGANINLTDQDGDTALITATTKARPLAQFYSQAQARHTSLWEQRAKIIQVLIDAGAHINHANKDKNTALMIAVKEYDLNTVESLLGAGAHVNHANDDGDTALIIAVKSIHHTYINEYEYNRCINSQKILEILFHTPGINLLHVNKNGETAISLINNLTKKWNK